jgi:hypothetical protein
MKSSSKKLFGAALALGLVANGVQAISAPSHGYHCSRWRAQVWRR